MQNITRVTVQYLPTHEKTTFTIRGRGTTQEILNRLDAFGLKTPEGLVDRAYRGLENRPGGLGTMDCQEFGCVVKIFRGYARTLYLQIRRPGDRVDHVKIDHSILTNEGRRGLVSQVVAPGSCNTYARYAHAAWDRYRLGEPQIGDVQVIDRFGKEG